MYFSFYIFSYPLLHNENMFLRYILYNKNIFMLREQIMKINTIKMNRYYGWKQIMNNFIIEINNIVI